MDLKKLFKRDKAPNNIGKNESDESVSIGCVNKNYLVFPDLTGEPTYELTDVISIGSQVGDVVISDENLSPRHCTISIMQDVVSIMDHNSSTGTFINKKQISPGKILILQEKDKIKLGSLTVVINSVEEAVYDETRQQAPLESTAQLEVADLGSNSEQEPELNLLDNIIEDDDQDLGEVEAQDLTISDLNNNELEQEEEQQAEPEKIEDEADDEKIRKTLKASGGQGLRDLSDKTLIFQAITTPSTNILIRVIAVIIEILIIVLSFSLLASEDEFFNLLKVYPSKLLLIITPYFNEYGAKYINQLLELEPALGVIWNEILDFFKSNEQVYFGLISYLVLRVSTTFIFSVSIGQALIGVKSSGNFIVKRIMGVLREIIGFITFPFLIFDLPCLFSKRTFKEIITFTHLLTPSKIKTFIISIFLILLLVLSYLLSPMFTNFDTKDSVPVNETSIQFKKSPLAKEDVERDNSKFLDLRILPKKNTAILPMFRVVQRKNKRKLIPTLKFLDLKSKKSINITKVKSFSLEKLLTHGVSSNFAAQLTHPRIVGVTKDIAKTNANFKQSSYTDQKLISEIENIIKSSFKLSLLNIHNHVLKNGPFLKGYVNLRFHLETIIGSQITTVSSAQLGDSPFIIFQAGRGLTFFQINKKQVNLYEASTSRVKDLVLMSSHIEWGNLNIEKTQQIRKLSLISLIDELLAPTEKSVEFYQSSYELLFEESKRYITTDDKKLTILLKKSIKSLVSVIDNIPGSNKDKFTQNITDLLKAIEDNDKSFFGISEIKSASIQTRY